MIRKNLFLCKSFLQLTENVTDVYSSKFHTCAIHDNGSLKCWGQNNHGQLGIGSKAQQTTPQTVELPGGRNVSFLSLGSYSSHISCAILDDKSLRCWGYNSGQEIVDNGLTNILDPVTMGT